MITRRLNPHRNALMKRRCAAATIAAILLIFSTIEIASAHANLVHASIRNNQVLKSGHVPKQIVATFAQDLDPKHSWMGVFEGEADHGLVTKNYHFNFKHPDQLTLTLPSLRVEKYYLIWYTHSAIDGHYAAGILYFRVKK